MLTSIQSAGVTPVVNLRITTHEKASEGSTPTLKLRADATRSPKTGVSMAPQKVSPFFFRKDN